MRDDRERLRDILDAIERIEKYSAKLGDPTVDEDLIQVWIIHHLMILGEACRALSAAFKVANPSDVWTQAAGLRNIIVHEYFGIDDSSIRDVVDNDIPAFKAQILRLLENA